MPGYAGMSTDSPEVIEEVVLYGRIVCTLSIGPYEKWVNLPQVDNIAPQGKGDFSRKAGPLCSGPGGYHL